MKHLGHVPLVSLKAHRRRVMSAGVVGVGLIGLSLAAGMVGYMTFEGLGFVDAFVNAAMILSGMGPLHNPESVAGKVFAGIYALYSGFAVLAIAAVMFAPVIHRVFHRLHIADTDDDPKT